MTSKRNSETSTHLIDIIKYSAVLRPCSKRWNCKRRCLSLKVHPYQKIVLQTMPLRREVILHEVNFDIEAVERDLLPLCWKGSDAKKRRRKNARVADNSDRHAKINSSELREESAALFFSPPPRDVAQRSRRPPIAPMSEMKASASTDDDGLPAIPISMSPDPENYDHF